MALARAGDDEWHDAREEFVEEEVGGLNAAPARGDSARGGDLGGVGAHLLEKGDEYPWLARASLAGLKGPGDPARETALLPERKDGRTVASRIEAIAAMRALVLKDSSSSAFCLTNASYLL